MRMAYILFLSLAKRKYFLSCLRDYSTPQERAQSHSVKLRSCGVFLLFDMRNLPIIGLVVSLLGLVSFRSPRELREFKIYGYAQGTTYSVTYFAKDSLVSKGEIDSILAVIDSSMSLYKDYSTISRFNKSDTGLVVDPHFIAVLQKSFEINKETRGLFDITVAPLMKFWGFANKDTSATFNTLEKILPCVGMQYLTLNGDTLTKAKPCVQIDVNGIAQGYSVDVVANYLSKKGISIFLVEIGGEISLKGPKPDGRPMKIGIEGPSDNSSKEPVVQHIVSIQKGAITTSGNYRNYLMRGKEKITHLIDPRTGKPLTNEMVSVTVYAPDAVTADGYDNALMAMSLKEALTFVNDRKFLSAYFIYRRSDGKLADTASAGFASMMENRMSQ